MGATKVLERKQTQKTSLAGGATIRGSWVGVLSLPTWLKEMWAWLGSRFGLSVCLYLVISYPVVFVKITIT